MIFDKFYKIIHKELRGKKYRVTLTDTRDESCICIIPVCNLLQIILLI
jgi:hypothetical protein